MRKNLMFALAGVLLLVIVASCASINNPELRRRAANVQMLDPEQAKGAQYTLLGEVEGRSCRSLDTVRENRKVNTAEMGGDAVTLAK